MRRSFGFFLVFWLAFAFVCAAQQEAAQGPPPAPAPAPEKASGEGAASPPAAKNGKKPRKAAAAAPAPTREDGPKKTVVREGGAKEPATQIAPGMSAQEAVRQRQNAEQLLDAAEDQLRMLAGRTLDLQQKETVGQIHNYMDGARQAFKEGDVRRANMLAEKAHLLAEDLVRH